MRTHQRLDRVGQRTRRVSIAVATSRNQNKPRVLATVGEARRCHWAEVLDVVCHDRSLLACSRVENLSVGNFFQIRTLTHRFNVKPALTQEAGDLMR